MKERVIYEREGKNHCRVYIHQCHNPRKKTNHYMIRRDDGSGLCWQLGSIRWEGSWRQYIFKSGDYTIWNYSCLIKISEFLKEINKKHREKLKRKKKSRITDITTL